jgi:phosphoribosylaminoimidazole (AIR) synthetase
MGFGMMMIVRKKSAGHYRPPDRLGRKAYLIGVIEKKEETRRRSAFGL